MITKQKNTRIISFFMAAALIISILFSVLFIIREMDHDCSGDDCPICFELKQAEKILTGEKNVTGSQVRVITVTLSEKCPVICIKVRNACNSLYFQRVGLLI
ncbi:hypothetical protein SAMN05660484_01662 [Eubacterium ruminantium]|jgi:hypothetical protein|uniref:Uncharacterized protein n=1 Tax=Eubacterium ruminantium TaxID=42322 RepID=A0A1T4NNS5_9FIRM|nr:MULTISPECIES: hypothetical protein [Eubacterium]MCR5368359.1 hypothetical protein [Eubacterium sp.]SCW54552.1 hypothetical protein SAMN05660484_01662 [Eubacterium ruminantium]SDM90567.1 hypothetical protein SAMN04490370_107138 [Eubacterium ruminantium]SJZ80970.1 hypothetical protein SAMN02745110_01662 [Eubacterium ruminantium]